VERRPPLILGIETSCDDTACAVVDGDGRVLASVVSSQLAHLPYGGVVPEIASREHLRNWPAVYEAALAAAGVGLTEIEAVAATRGPGLVGALLVGLSLGKSLAYGLGREFHGVHHMEAHLFSPFLRLAGEPAETPPESFVGLVVSGGHSLLLRVESTATSESIETLAETRDDAIGEAFDKLGKRLGLPYPQGPKVDALAERGDPARCPLPLAGRANPQNSELYFSYSGLKSQALLELEKLGRRGVDRALTQDANGGFDLAPEVLDLVAGFRAAAVAQLLDRLSVLHRRRPVPLLAVSGGVAANRLLRREVAAWGERHGVPVRLVPLAYSGDNAAMIAWRALLRHRAGLADDPFAVEAQSRIAL
jgi:N6-L-threonylcarbamoyladenine synthase